MSARCVRMLGNLVYQINHLRPFFFLFRCIDFKVVHSPSNAESTGQQRQDWADFCLLSTAYLCRVVMLPMTRLLWQAARHSTAGATRSDAAICQLPKSFVTVRRCPVHAQFLPLGTSISDIDHRAGSFCCGTAVWSMCA